VEKHGLLHAFAFAVAVAIKVFDTVLNINAAPWPCSKG
jgi:hypothetical protein